MHRCLMIPEIFLVIIDALPRKLNTDKSMLVDISNWAEIPSMPNHTDALAIALTCKTFLEPALDALWFTMYSLDALLALSVPAGQPDPHAGQENDAPRHSRMDRFAYYAHRIRVLQSWDDQGIPIAWRALSIVTWRQSQPILPNLRHLVWKHADPATFPYISLFAGPFLQSLVLYPRELDDVHDDTIFSSLSTLARFSPMLSQLILEDDYVDADDQSYAESILHLSAFRFVTSVYLLTPASYEVIRQLSGMPYLRSLRLDIFGRDYERPDAFTKLGFASLQELKLRLGDLDVLTRILEFFSDQLGIQTINIETDGYESAPAINDLIKAVCQICSPEILTSFTFAMAPSTDEHDPPSDSVINNITLSPLFIFRSMVSFSLSAFNPNWDGRLLESIANAWPNLRLLVLSRYDGQPSGFTFNGLASLAKGCPRLKYVDLPLASWNANVGGTTSHTSKELIRRSPLHMVLCYPLPTLEAAAESYLRLVFPNLSQLDVEQVDDL